MTTRTAARTAPKPVRARARTTAKKKVARVRWSKEREDRFLDVLAQTGNVAECCRLSKLSDTTVYRKRTQSPEFRARWAAALREGFVKLETEMLRRALAGTDKPVFHGGKQIGTVKDFDNRTCLALLNAHRAAVTGAAPVAPEMTEDEMRKAIAARLSEMNRNMGGDG